MGLTCSNHPGLSTGSSHAPIVQKFSPSQGLPRATIVSRVTEASLNESLKYLQCLGDPIRKLNVNLKTNFSGLINHF